MKLFIECVDSTTREMYEGTNRIKHSTDSGFDLHCPDTININPEGLTNIDLGIKCWSPDKIGYMLVPRSSIYNYNIMLANSIGIIDAGYTGNIRANVFHYMNKPNGGIIANNIMFIFMTILTHMMFSATIEFATIGTCIWIFMGSVVINARYNRTTIRAGTRLFQFVAFDGKPIEIEFVDKLPEEANDTTRGENGFGSTDADSNAVMIDSEIEEANSEASDSDIGSNGDDSN